MVRGEIADDEFFSVMMAVGQEEQKIGRRLKRGGKIGRSKPLDVFLFLFIALKYFPDYNFIEFKVDGFVQDILQPMGTFTDGELHEAFRLHPDCANEVERNSRWKLNPCTKIPYCPARYDRQSFLKLLSVYQQDNMDF